MARLKTRIVELLVLAAVAVGLSACAAQPPSQQQPQQSLRSPDRFIYVTAQDLPGACYHDLGAVQFQEPFAQASIDRDTSEMAKQLRGQALSKYPEDVDAVIKVRSITNDVGTMVSVSGEAVELKSHGTVECAMRKVPGVLDAAAVTAAGGMVGTIAGGLAGGSPTTAIGGAGLGAAAAAGYTAVQSRQAEQQQQDRIRQTLAKQRGEIVQLLSERARLRECEEQEKSLPECKASETLAGEPAAAQDSDSAADSNVPPYELQKQIQEQQEYITQLKSQISDMRLRMAGYK
jgi:hypothetical protein